MIKCDFLKELDRIIQKGFINSTDYEIAFLKARITYLNDKEKKDLNDYLTNVDVITITKETKLAEKNIDEVLSDVVLSDEPQVDKRLKVYRLWKQKKGGGKYKKKK